MLSDSRSRACADVNTSGTILYIGGNMTKILNLGRLSDQKWSGTVSADHVFVDCDRIVAGLDAYYVTTNPDAKTRCIDGRHDPELDESNLGPQVPGGAPGASLAYRLGVDKDDLTRGTFYNDVETMIESYERLGLSPGGHRDDTLRDHGVGCGAIDGIEQVLVSMTEPKYVEDLKRLVKTLLDTTFDRDNFLRVLGAGLVVRSRSTGYFDGHGDVLDILEKKSPGSVSVLKGEHKEVLFIVNLVPNTTFASNRFASEHEGQQAFGYDIWRSKQLAQMLLPLPSQALDRERFVTARVMITIATLMTLTDGSQRFMVRFPDENE